MISLVIVDDHVVLREGLLRKFQDCEDIEVVGQAGTIADLMRMLPKYSPCVVILDIKLPDGNGLTVLKEMKQRFPRVRVVVLTMYNHPRYAIQALGAGAEGFVLKGSPFAELLQAVRMASRRKAYVCAEIAPELMRRFQRPGKAMGVDSLSPREFEALTMLVPVFR